MVDQTKTDAATANSLSATAQGEDTLMGAQDPNYRTEDHPVTETAPETPQVAETAMPTGVRPVLNQTAAGIAHRLTERLGERFAPGSVKVEPNAEGTTINVTIYGKDGAENSMGFGVTQLRLSPDPLNTVLTAMLSGFGSSVAAMMGDYDHNYEMSNAPVFDEAMMKARAARAAAAAPLTQPEDRIERRANYTPQPPTNPPVPGIAPVEADAQTAVVRGTDVSIATQTTLSGAAADPRLAASVAAGMQMAMSAGAGTTADGSEAPARSRARAAADASRTSATKADTTSADKSTSRTKDAADK